jgi:predicted RNA binding protein YcfA (HicA-like mRNA interferase family)
MLKNSRDIIRRLEREGFVQTSVRGSHHKFRHPDGRTVIVPHPKKDLPIGTVYEVYNQAKWPRD